MNIDQLKSSNCIIFECISGSRAYGLATPTSDTDIRGVFISPPEIFYSLNYVDQINNESNDIVYYEIRKFAELLLKNNPNILELLNISEEFILYKHPLFEQFKPNIFLSKLCENTFANYAFTQIKKARSLNKKIVKPMEPVRKGILDFCYVYENKLSENVISFLEKNNMKQEFCGLSAIPHIADCFNLFYDENANYKGIISKQIANDVSLSSIEKGKVPLCLLYFNKNAYSIYCKEFREYNEWIEKRNEERFNTTISHNKNYDSKNIMHTYRLLEMAKEIGLEGKIQVYRPNREFLLDIKSGKFEYDDLVNQAENLKNELCLIFQNSDLPEIPNELEINTLLVNIRKEFYANY